MFDTVRPFLHTTLLTLVIGFYYIATWQTLDQFVISLDHCSDLFCDFIEVYYPAGKAFLESRTPPSGYFYSPSFGVLLALFGLVSMDTALWFWGVGQVVMTFLLGAIPGVIFLKRYNRHFNLYVLLFLTSMPVLHNFKWGQLSVFLTLCLFSSLLLYQKDHKLPSAVLLSIATSVKFYAAIFLIYSLLRRDFRYIGFFALSTLLLMLVVPFTAIDRRGRNLSRLSIAAGFSISRRRNLGAKRD